MMIWVWLAAVAIFAVVEAVTAGMVCIWFAVGAVAGFLAALFDLPELTQLVAFVGVSAVALVATRPLVRKINSSKMVPTNLDRVLGESGKVTETIDNESSAGAVYVDGKTWTARSADGSVIPAGRMVKIVKMEGVKLFVEKTEILEGVQP